MMRINQRIVASLEDVYRSATLESCGVGAEHKEAMRLYTHTWIACRLAMTLAAITNEDHPCIFCGGTHGPNELSHN